MGLAGPGCDRLSGACFATCGGSRARGGRSNSQLAESPLGEPLPVTDTAATGKRIVLTAVGSLGDLHPSIAIGLGLKAAWSRCRDRDRRSVPSQNRGARAWLPALAA